MILDIFLEMPTHQLLLVKEELCSQHFLITIAHRKRAFSGNTYMAILKPVVVKWLHSLVLGAFSRPST